MNLTVLLVATLLNKSPDVRPPAAPTVIVSAGQTPAIVNPTGLGFNPSADHSVIENGVPVVTKYTVDFFAASTPTVVERTADLGKPSPDAQNVITWSGLPAVRVLLPLGSHTAKVCAEGSGGRGCSVMSDPFTAAVRAPVATGKPTWIQ